MYLALDRVYDLLSAACASNATHREKGLTLAQQIARVHTGLSPSTAPQSLLSSGTPLVAGLSDRVAVGFKSDLSLNATFRRRLLGPGGSALGSSLFSRPY